jgi:hypothetical protein
VSPSNLDDVIARVPDHDHPDALDDGRTRRSLPRLGETSHLLEGVRRRAADIPQGYLVLAVALVVFGLAVYRNPSLGTSQFVYDEAGAYWAMTFAQNPIAFLFDTWVGYLNVLPRAVFLAARIVPPELAPAFERTIESVVIAAVAAFFASDRFGAIVPSRWARAGFGLSLGLLPTFAPYGSILHVHWVTAAFLAGLSVLPDRRWTDYPAAVIAVLSGVPAALAAPFFFLRRPDRLAVVVAVGAAVQLFATLEGTRSRHHIDLEEIAIQLGPAGLTALALALVAVKDVPHRAALALLGTGILVLLAGSASAKDFGAPVYERFVVTYWIGIAFIGMVAAAKRRLAGLILVALVISLGVSATLRTGPVDGEWATNARCIGGPVPCVVPINPSRYDVHWPGDAALYKPPPRGGYPAPSPSPG